MASSTSNVALIHAPAHGTVPISLPPELIKLVAHHLRNDRQALHACLLVSRAWSQAAVEYLYKAEHMLSDRTSIHSCSDLDPLSSSFSILPLSSDFDGLTLLDQNRSPFISTSDTRAQRLLMRTLEASLLHDQTCSYDYISYLEKISCSWFANLIQDWTAFCITWRGYESRTAASITSSASSSPPSEFRQERCFNRLIRKVSKRCISVDEFQSSAKIETSTLIYAISRFSNLARLDLRNSQDLNDDLFYAIAKTVHSLSYIRLHGFRMKQTSSQAVAEMILAQNRDKLQSFKVVKGTNIFEERHAQSMRHLTLSICNLESSGLEEFGPLLSNLTSLNLEYSSGVTDDSLLPILDRCHQLVKLDLTEVDCTQVVIQGLSAASDSTTSQQGRLSSMKRLILNNIDAPFTANLFIPLAKACPNLEALHMNSILADSFSDFELFISKMQRIRDLDIGNVFPEFSDDNLKSLVNILPDLRWLSIANTQITNESLVYLSEQATNLCDLCILGCDQVTKMGVIEFLDKITAHQRTTVFKRLDITYCRLDEGAVTEIRERAKSVTGIIEIEGDDQFTDSIDDDEEGDREEGVENDDHEGSEDEEQDFEYDENDGYDVEEYQEDDDIDGTNNSAIESAVQIEGLMSDYSDEEM